MIAIYGPSGSGKTTSVNIISGLIRPFKGKVLVDNKDINESSESLQNGNHQLPMFLKQFI